MKLELVRIRGFRTFTEDVEYEFPEGGFHLVMGRNDAEPKLGANRTGKSTFWDAVCWCGWGKTARKLSGPSVDAWSA